MYTSTANMNSSYRGLASYTAAYTTSAESNNSARSNGYNPSNTYGGYSNPNANYARSACGAQSVRSFQNNRGIRPTGYSNGFAQVRSSSFSSVTPMSIAFPYTKDRSQSITGSYNPSSSSANSGGGGPSRIRVYNGPDDDTGQNTPGGNSDSGAWLYEYDSTTGEWWCSKDGGNSWYKWDSWWGWGLVGFDWRPGRGDPTENATHYHQDKNNPWVVPITDTPWILMALLALCYLTFISFRATSRTRALHSVVQ